MAQVAVNGVTFKVSLADTEAAGAFAVMLESGPVELSLSEYGGFEKVGPLPGPLPAADEQVTTEPGDIVLYNGNQLSLFYGSNSWEYTRLGKVEGATAEVIAGALGSGDVVAVFSLPAAQ